MLPEKAIVRYIQRGFIDKLIQLKTANHVCKFKGDSTIKAQLKIQPSIGIAKNCFQLQRINTERNIKLF